METDLTRAQPSLTSPPAARLSRVGSVLFSIYAWAVFLSCVAIALPLVALTLTVASRRTAYWLGGRIFKFCLALVGIRVSVSGLDCVRPGQALIMMGNHVSLLDGFVLPAVLPFPTLAVEKRENFAIPVYGWFMRKWGNIPIAREDRVQAIRDLDSARAYLFGNPDVWIVVMPEGTRTPDGSLGPFKKGGFHLAVATGAPIVPYTLVGSYDVHHKGSWLVHPGEMEVVLHPAIDPSAYGRERLNDLMATVRRAIASRLPARSNEPLPAGIEREDAGQIFP